MTADEYETTFSVSIEREVGTDRIVSETWRTPDGELHRDGDEPAVYKLNRPDGREQEFRAWYLNGKWGRTGGPASMVIDLESGVVIHETYAIDDAIHRDGDDEPAVINRSRSTGRVVRHQFSTDGVRDRHSGPAVIYFDQDTGEQTRVEYWRKGRQIDPNAPDPFDPQP